MEPIAAAHGATIPQVALAWLLALTPKQLKTIDELVAVLHRPRIGPHQARRFLAQTDRLPATPADRSYRPGRCLRGHRN